MISWFILDVHKCLPLPNEIPSTGVSVNSVLNKVTICRYSRIGETNNARCLSNAFTNSRNLTVSH